MKRAEDSLRDLWDNIQHTNIQIIGVPEGEEKKQHHCHSWHSCVWIQALSLWSGRTNIQIIGVPEEEKKKGYEKIFEEVIVENFPKMEKEIVNQVQESHTG